MSVEEFLAWFVGYTEAISRRPSAKQWARVIENASQISGHPAFKAWFEGFSEHLKGVPSLEDWRKVMARVREEQARAHGTKYRESELFRLFEEKAGAMAVTPHLKELYQRGKNERED
jgi:hypothetical protein